MLPRTFADIKLNNCQQWAHEWPTDGNPDAPLPPPSLAPVSELPCL